jgi:hypothetical protein
MTRPALLRARARIDLDTMAARLGVSVADVRALEALDVRLWELGTLADYCTALGAVLHVQALTRDSIVTLF